MPRYYSTNSPADSEWARRHFEAIKRTDATGLPRYKGKIMRAPPRRGGAGITTVARRAAVSNNPALLYPRRGMDSRRRSYQYPSSHLPPQRSILVPRRGIKGFFKKVGRIAKKVAKPVHKVSHAISGLAHNFLGDIKDPRVQGALQALSSVDHVSGAIQHAGGRKALKEQAKDAATAQVGEALRRMATRQSNLRSELSGARDAAIARAKQTPDHLGSLVGYGKRKPRSRPRKYRKY